MPQFPSSVRAQSVVSAFQQVNGSVVLVRAKGRDLNAHSGTSVLVGFNEIRSGVLMSHDGKVLTAAHVVQIADDITVHFTNGEAVTAHVVASEHHADVALLQLSHVPAGVQPDLAEYFNLPQPFGLLVEEVADRSTAKAIGLRPGRASARLNGEDLPLGGDIVLAAMGIQLVDVTSFRRVHELWSQLRPGDEMTFKVLRAGHVIDLRGRLPEPYRTQEAK